MLVASLMSSFSMKHDLELNQNVNFEALVSSLFAYLVLYFSMTGKIFANNKVIY